MAFKEQVPTQDMLPFSVFTTVLFSTLSQTNP